MRSLCSRHHSEEFARLSSSAKYKAARWVTVEPALCELCGAVTLTTKDLAAHFNVDYNTVATWCRLGLLDAHKEPGTRGRGGEWRIPTSAVAQFQRPTRGRPPKTTLSIDK